MTGAQDPDDDTCNLCLGINGTHHDECPIKTNWWHIDPQAPVQCHQCKAWFTMGRYRFIPTLPEDNDLADLDSGFWWDHGTKVVCEECATLKVVRDAKGS